MKPFALETIIDLRKKLLAKEISSTDLTQYFLDRIQSLDSKVNAFAEVYADRALETANNIDSNGDALAKPLAGIPIAIKDNLCTDYGHTTCSSRMLSGYQSPFTATSVSRLEAAGAIIIGKTNMDEFAMGSSSEHGTHGGVRNPWDISRVPGGSSGGSAAALSAGFCAAALGSDTGGSIRQPAALCGAVGYKPTYGRVSRWGLVAFASSLDQIGPFTRSSADAALITAIMGGGDPKDSTCDPSSSEDLKQLPDIDLKGLRVGVVSEYVSEKARENIDPACQKAFDDVLNELKAAGAEIMDVHLPHAEYAIPVYYLVATSEASSNLARFDGVHYGHRAALSEGDDIVALFSKSRAEGFGEEVQRRIMLGTFALSSGYYDAYYNKALKVRRLLRQDFDSAFAACDVMLTPTTTEVAFKAGEKSEDPLAMYLNDFFTVSANLTGVPAIHLPTNLSDVDDVKLPVGVQLLASPMQDAKLLAIAEKLQSRITIESKLPELS